MSGFCDCISNLKGYYYELKPKNYQRCSSLGEEESLISVILRSWLSFFFFFLNWSGLLEWRFLIFASVSCNLIFQTEFDGCLHNGALSTPLGRYDAHYEKGITVIIIIQLSYLHPFLYIDIWWSHLNSIGQNYKWLLSSWALLCI